MKKKIFALFTALLIAASLLASCSGKSYDSATSDTANSMSSTNEYSTSVGGMDDSYSVESVGDFSYSDSESYSEKVIYTADAQIETTDFDTSLENIYRSIEFYDAYLESSYVTGKSYSSQFYGYQTYRYAQLVIRVPSKGYQNLTQNLSLFGNVLNLTQNSDNITEQYYDVQSRLDTYEIEEERILSMLEKAETVADMIELESRLSDIRYQIESLESRLRTWQNQVDYSTVTIELNEVAELTQKVEVQRTYWQEIGDGIKASAKSVASFFKKLFMNFVIALPVIVTIAVVVVIVIIIIKKIKSPMSKRRRSKDETDNEEK